MKESYKEPVYTVGIVAKLLSVCPATLRIWEKKGLIKPARIGKNRFYSKFDMEKLEYIKILTHKKRINIEGVKNLLRKSCCWEIKKCKSERRKGCPVYSRYSNT